MKDEIKCPSCGDNMGIGKEHYKTNIIQCKSCKTFHQLSSLKKEQIKDVAPRSPYRKEVSTYQNAHFSLRSIPSLTELPDKPHGSKIEIRPNYSDIELTLPINSIRAGEIFMMVFATFWLGFVAVWTFFAASAFFVMALFSIPFWLVGLSMWNGILKRLTEKQTIKIDTQAITIIKKRLFFQNEEHIPFEHINSISFKNATLKNFTQGIGNSFSKSSMNSRNRNAAPEVPTIQAGVKSYTFMENLLEIEQEWGIEFLNQMLRQK